MYCDLDLNYLKMRNAELSHEISYTRDSVVRLKTIIQEGAIQGEDGEWMELQPDAVDRAAKTLKHLQHKATTLTQALAARQRR